MKKYDTSLPSIGNRISFLRQREGLTQQELADLLNTRRENVSYWENGTRDIKSETIVLLAEKLNTTCDYLLRGVESENVDIHKKIGLSNSAVNILKTICMYDSLRDGVNVFIESPDFVNFANDFSEVLRCSENIKGAWEKFYKGPQLHEHEVRISSSIYEKYDLHVFRLIKRLIKITDHLKEKTDENT